MADRIVVMNQGVIEQVGTPAEIYHEPATFFVADSIGTMNFLPGTRPTVIPSHSLIEMHAPLSRLRETLLA